jgi:hypothetical protein
MGTAQFLRTYVADPVLSTTELAGTVSPAGPFPLIFGGNSAISVTGAPVDVAETVGGQVVGAQLRPTELTFPTTSGFATQFGSIPPIPVTWGATVRIESVDAAGNPAPFPVAPDGAFTTRLRGTILAGTLVVGGTPFPVTGLQSTVEAVGSLTDSEFFLRAPLVSGLGFEFSFDVGGGSQTTLLPRFMLFCPRAPTVARTELGRDACVGPVAFPEVSIAPVSSPVLGGTFVAAASDTSGSGTAVAYLWGIPAGALAPAIDLGLFAPSLAGCRVLVDLLTPGGLFGVQSQPLGSPMTLPIPNVPALEGLTGLTVQALVLRANGMPGFVPTGELVLTLGL